MKKEPFRQESKKNIPRCLMALFILVVALFMCASVMNGTVINKNINYLIDENAETNRLLSTFQRMDTVKGDVLDLRRNCLEEAKKTGGYCQLVDGGITIYHSGDLKTDPAPGCQTGYLQCIPTIGKARGKSFPDDNQFDPNFCQTWVTKCHGPRCGVTCNLEDEK